MVAIRNVIWTQKFEHELRKLKDKSTKKRVKKQVQEIIEQPDKGKPLRFDLKGERSIRIAPYRHVYAEEGETVYLLRFEHRKLVYH